MIDPDDLYLMTEREKLDLLRQMADAEEWQECFEPIHRTLMDDGSPLVRQQAIAALWDVAGPRHIETLTDKAMKDPDVEVRAKAASVLGIFIYEAVVNGSLSESEHLGVRRFLLDIAQDPNEEMLVRRMAIESLSFDDDEVIHDLIEWAYRQPSTEMKMTALFSMGRSHSARWHDAILAEIASQSPDLRVVAVNAAGEAEIAAATPNLRNLAASPHKDTRLAAIWALSHTRGPGALETIEMCTQDDDEEVRRVANDAVDEFYDIEQMVSEEREDIEGFDD